MTEVKVTNRDSILDSIKKLLGPSADYKEFDQDIITYINGTFLDLQQIGVGPVEGFFITGSNEIWLDFDKNELILNAVKPYMYIKVKLIFDPPTSSFVLESLQRMADKFEWRINLAIEESKNGGAK